MDDYESWLRSELVAAQARVAEMNSALSLFLAWRKRGTNGTNHNIQGIHDNGAHRRPRQRASKNDVIFAAFEAAGAAGLNQEEVARVAAEAGLNTNANALRALCWTAKKAGRLISLAPGRYAIAPQDEAAPRLPDNRDGEAASTRMDHNQHREGDVGGGT